MATWFFIFAHFSILALAVLGGVFLVFSDFVMRSLAKTGGRGGVEAMQRINEEVFRYVFMPLFLGMVPVLLTLAGYAFMRLPEPASSTIIAGACVYLVGGFGITVACNVPLNNTLASMEAGSPDTHRFWFDTYLPRWTFWNTVRTVACVISAAMMQIGLFWASQSSPV